MTDKESIMDLDEAGFEFKPQDAHQGDLWFPQAISALVCHKFSRLLYFYAKFYFDEDDNLRFAQILRGFKNCGRVSGAKEVHHGRAPDHSQ